MSERANASSGDERAPERGNEQAKATANEPFNERTDSPYSTHDRVLAAISDALANPPVGLVLVELLIELDGIGDRDDVGGRDDADGGDDVGGRDDADGGDRNEPGEQSPIDQRLIDEAILTRIERETAPDDVVLRTGPDRLTIIKPSLSAPAEAEGFALRIQAGLQSSMIVGEGRLKLQSAIGVAVSKTGDTAEDMVRYAAHALGDARMLGGDLMVAFDDQDRDLLI